MPEGGRKSPVRDLFLMSALWMPLGFFLWFQLATVLVFPLARLLDGMLGWSLGANFDRVFQHGYWLEIDTLLPLAQPVNGQVGLLAWDVNPMVYGYGLPLLMGLVMATPLSLRRRLAQMGIGYLMMLVVQAWGTFFEVHKDLRFKFSGLLADPTQLPGMPEWLIALGYQLGYLILPAVVPIATWILLNRVFLEHLVRSRKAAGPG